MEREWRGLEDLEFALADIARVIPPRDFAPRLRRDMPDYAAQVAYVESLGG